MTSSCSLQLLSRNELPSQNDSFLLHSHYTQGISDRRSQWAWNMVFPTFSDLHAYLRSRDLNWSRIYDFFDRMSHLFDYPHLFQWVYEISRTLLWCYLPLLIYLHLNRNWIHACHLNYSQLEAINNHFNISDLCPSLYQMILYCLNS